MQNATNKHLKFVCNANIYAWRLSVLYFKHCYPKGLGAERFRNMDLLVPGSWFTCMRQMNDFYRIHQFYHYRSQIIISSAGLLLFFCRLNSRLPSVCRQAPLVAKATTDIAKDWYFVLSHLQLKTNLRVNTLHVFLVQI